MNQPQLQINFKQDKEIFVPIKGYEGLYSISNYGRVWSSYCNDFLKPHLTKLSYYQLMLCKNKIRKVLRINRLVLQAFIPNPENKPYGNHKDGNKINNHISNLEWVTHKENIQHAHKIGLFDKSIDRKKGLYEVTFPDKHIEIIKGMSEFCRKHHLVRGDMTDLALNTTKRSQHKGYKCKKIIFDKPESIDPYADKKDKQQFVRNVKGTNP